MVQFHLLVAWSLGKGLQRSYQMNGATMPSSPRGMTKRCQVLVASKLSCVKAQGPLRCDLHEVVVMSNDD